MPERLVDGVLRVPVPRVPSWSLKPRTSFAQLVTWRGITGFDAEIDAAFTVNGSIDLARALLDASSRRDLLAFAATLQSFAVRDGYLELAWRQDLFVHYDQLAVIMSPLALTIATRAARRIIELVDAAAPREEPRSRHAR